MNMVDLVHLIENYPFKPVDESKKILDSVFGEDAYEVYSKVLVDHMEDDAVMFFELRHDEPILDFFLPVYLKYDCPRPYQIAWRVICFVFTGVLKLFEDALANPETHPEHRIDDIRRVMPKIKEMVKHIEKSMEEM